MNILDNILQDNNMDRTVKSKSRNKDADTRFATTSTSAQVPLFTLPEWEGLLHNLSMCLDWARRDIFITFTSTLSNVPFIATIWRRIWFTRESTHIATVRCYCTYLMHLLGEACYMQLNKINSNFYGFLSAGGLFQSSTIWVRDSPEGMWNRKGGIVSKSLSVEIREPNSKMVPVKKVRNRCTLIVWSFHLQLVFQDDEHHC